MQPSFLTCIYPMVLTLSVPAQWTIGAWKYRQTRATSVELFHEVGGALTPLIYIWSPDAPSEEVPRVFVSGSFKVENSFLAMQQRTHHHSVDTADRLP